MSNTILQVYNSATLAHLNDLTKEYRGLAVDLDRVQICAIILETNASPSFHFYKEHLPLFTEMTWYNNVEIPSLNLALEFDHFTKWMATAQIYINGEPISYKDLIETYRPNSTTTNY